MNFKLYTKLISLITLLMLGNAASANTNGYVCQTSYLPTTVSALGNEGYLYVTMYTGANCTGSYIGTSYLCSTGATSIYCPDLAAFHHTRESLLANLQASANAAETGQQVFIYDTYCNGGSLSCAFRISYRGSH